MHPSREAILKARNVETATEILMRANEAKAKIKQLEMRRGAMSLRCVQQKVALEQMFPRLDVTLKGTIYKGKDKDAIEYWIRTKHNKALILQGKVPAADFPGVELLAKMALIG